MSGIEKSQNTQIQVSAQFSLEDALDRHEADYGEQAVEQAFHAIAGGREYIQESEWDETILNATARSLKQSKLSTKTNPEAAPVNLKLGTRKNAVDPGMAERLAQRFDNNKTKVDALAATLEDDLAGADLKLYAKKLAGFRITVLKEMIGTDRDLIEAAQQPIEDPLLQSLVGNFEEDLLSMALSA